MIGRLICDQRNSSGVPAMTQQDFERKLDEVDRLLNDPAVQLEPGRVWSLLAEVKQPDMARYAKAR